MVMDCHLGEDIKEGPEIQIVLNYVMYVFVIILTRTRLKAKNLLYIQQLLYVLTCFLNCLGGKLMFSVVLDVVCTKVKCPVPEKIHTPPPPPPTQPPFPWKVFWIECLWKFHIGFVLSFTKRPLPLPLRISSDLPLWIYHN